MKNRIRSWILALLFAATSGGALVSVAVPQVASAACAGARLLTLPAWYNGLQEDNCTDIKNPSDVGGIGNFIWRIGLNVVEALLQIVGYVSVAFIITGGFKYMTAAGSADQIKKAKGTIENAIIGLVISIFSVAIVNLIAGSL